MMNENDQREVIRRILHDFVMLKVAGDTTIKQVAERLEASTSELYRVFEDDLTQYRFDFLAHGRMCELLEEAGYSPDEHGVQALLLERNDLHHTVQEVEKVVDLADPKLRREFSLYNAVAWIAADLVLVRKILERIGEHVEDGLR